MILRVGLTGGTASGKSTVARMLRDLGAEVIDADGIVHELYRPGEAGHRAVVKRYGTDILNEDGTISRQKLAGLAFADAKSAAELNALIHPLVRKREEEMLSQQEQSGNDRIFVIEATLLLEAGGRERYARIIAVEAPRRAQIDRAVRRGMSAEDAERRIKRQMTPEERRRKADYVVVNDGDLAQLGEKTRQIYGQLQADLQKRKRSKQ